MKSTSVTNLDLKRYLSLHEQASLGYNLPQLQVASASVSLAASLAMAIMIYSPRSGGLSTPYRRIIFGLSVSDIIQSFSLSFGPWLVPSGIPDSWGLGNQRTCSFNGFFMVVGQSAVPMYMFFLCLYYLCKIKFRMTNASFSLKYEWKLHVFVIMFNIIMASVALCLDVLNPISTKTYCQIGATPLNCRVDPSIECDPRTNIQVTILILLNSMCIPVISFIGIISIMCNLLLHATSWKLRFSNISHRQSHNLEPGEINLSPISRLGPSGTRMVRHGRLRDSELLDNLSSLESLPMDFVELNLIGGRSESIENDFLTKDCTNLESLGCDTHTLEATGAVDIDERSIKPLTIDSHTRPGPSSPRQHIVEPATENAQDVANLYRKQAFLQATCYMAAFFFAYAPMSILYLMVTFEATVPIWMFQLTVVLFPLCGAFNIIIYCSPYVANLRRECPHYSRFQAFLIVIKAGGERREVEQSSQGIKMDSNHEDKIDLRARFDQSIDDPESNYEEIVERKGDPLTKSSKLKSCSLSDVGFKYSSQME